MTKQNLVLIPGLVCDDQVWRHQAEFLSDIAEITIPPVVKSPTIFGLAEEVLAISPETFAVAGFSMGGYVAMEMYRQAPERISRLALLDTTARDDTKVKAEARIKAIDACEKGHFSEVIQGMIPILLHPDHQREPLTDFVQKMAARVGSEAFVRRHRAMQSRQDSRDLISSCNIPVRAICGRQDAMCSVVEHEEMANLAKFGRLSVIEECGHMTILERPHAATALLRGWLIHD